eukprot:scaffold19238_cov121-Isochrysis_galbana.AAC.5
MLTQLQPFQRPASRHRPRHRTRPPTEARTPRDRPHRSHAPLPPDTSGRHAPTAWPQVAATRAPPPPVQRLSPPTAHHDFLRPRQAHQTLPRRAANPQMMCMPSLPPRRNPRSSLASIRSLWGGGACRHGGRPVCEGYIPGKLACESKRGPADRRGHVRRRCRRKDAAHGSIRRKRQGPLGMTLGCVGTRLICKSIVCLTLSAPSQRTSVSRGNEVGRRLHERFGGRPLTSSGRAPSLSGQHAHLPLRR